MLSKCYFDSECSHFCEWQIDGFVHKHRIIIPIQKSIKLSTLTLPRRLTLLHLSSSLIHSLSLTLTRTYWEDEREMQWRSTAMCFMISNWQILMWMTQTSHDIRIFNAYRLNNHIHTHTNKYIPKSYHRIINIWYIYMRIVVVISAFRTLCHLICGIMVGSNLRPKNKTMCTQRWPLSGHR